MNLRDAIAPNAKNRIDLFLDWANREKEKRLHKSKYAALERPLRMSGNSGRGIRTPDTRIMIPLL